LEVPVQTLPADQRLAFQTFWGFLKLSWENNMNIRHYHPQIASIVETPCEYPENQFSGAGIVICAGGRTYFTCAWVLVNMLRRLGCCLPIEVWYRGPHEMSDVMRRTLESVTDVYCMNAADQGDGRRLDGWEVKPYAITHSRFEEVLFLDCDNVPTRDPSGLFEEDAYRRFGAVFWPDRWMGKGDPDSCRTIWPQAWEACDVVQRDEPEFETGQMVIHKRRCWRALQLTMFLNKHSDFFYRWLLGDKDTFHMAWRRIAQPYGMPMFRPEQDSENGPVLYQHDFQGRRFLQHRNQDKWDYDGGNLRIPAFEHEDICLEFLRCLRQRWDGVVRRYPDDYTDIERNAIRQIVDHRLFQYAGYGKGLRLIEMKPSFEIGLGKSQWETAWDVEQRGRGVSLTLHNGNRKMCILDQSGEAAWQGRCLHFEKAPITVGPIAHLPTKQRAVAEEIRTLLGRPVVTGWNEIEGITATGPFLYRRIGHDRRPMELSSDHTIARGAGGLERWWFLNTSTMPFELQVWGESGLTCGLVQHADGVWRGSWRLHEKMPVELVPGPHALGGGSLAYCEATSDKASGALGASYDGIASSEASRAASDSYYGSTSSLLNDSSDGSSYYGSSSGPA
jgi:hypothetical protein